MLSSKNIVVPKREEVVTDVLMFVIQHFPIDLESLQTLLTLSQNFNIKLKHNTLLWVAIANRASRGCQACFLEVRESAQYSSSPGSQYWCDVVEVFTASSSLRRQWGINMANRTFVNTGLYSSCVFNNSTFKLLLET